MATEKKTEQFVVIADRGGRRLYMAGTGEWYDEIKDAKRFPNRRLAELAERTSPIASGVIPYKP